MIVIDAKMAYELQMQYMQESQNANANTAHRNIDYNTNNPAVHNTGSYGSYGSHNVAGSYDGVQGFHPVDGPQGDPVKKKGFYKKLKRKFLMWSV